MSYPNETNISPPRMMFPTCDKRNISIRNSAETQYFGSRLINIEIL